MERRKQLVILLNVSLLLISGCGDTIVPSGSGGNGTCPPTENIVLHDKFTENFSEETSEFFDFRYRTSRDDFRYFPGVPSLSERNTDIMMLRIDPSDAAGAARGCEIMSKDHTFYGTYSVRLRVPDIRKAQPDAGIVAGLAAYRNDDSSGLGEIYFEWLAADPTIIYAGTRTGSLAKPHETGKTLKPADVINGFDASAQFHTYGFDWKPDKVIWWILNPENKEKVVLMEHDGKEFSKERMSRGGIPAAPAQFRLNFWHSKLKPAENRPTSVEPPKYPYELEIDWMSYVPYAETIK
ncbi:MAG: glycoside hydrolase family 16 protein [Bacteroidales bacterium]|nr:glycoside hydrolase family 16 protein [Bacteroidales bacterium]